MLLRITGLLVVFFLLIHPGASAQNISESDLSKVKVDELSDGQIRQFIEQAESRGLSQQELETLALARGMPASEIAKLKQRIQRLQGNKSANEVKDEGQERTLNFEKGEGDLDLFDTFIPKVREKRQEESDILSKIYGYSLFNTKNLTFEPSFNIPTPEDYQLGAGDELSINIWGASEATYQLTVTPEGYIRVPNLGLIYLNGLSIDKARSRIFYQLTRIYAGLKPRDGSNPNTFAQISLASVRSIKVTILGEANLPGTYTLPSLATVFNALYASGGPSVNGSFRTIQVIRDNKVEAELDIYDFLLTGIAKNNIRLRDQDLIKISPYAMRVEVGGEVKREGLYEAIEGETVADLIKFAGGYTERAFQGRLMLDRVTKDDMKVLDVENPEQVELQNGDKVSVEQVLDRYANRVEIKGAVFRPGFYELTEGLTAKSLIEKAQGLREDAFMNRASIYRFRENMTVEVVSFNLGSLMDGSIEDIPLKRDDLIQISSIFELKEGFTINIQGEVLEPGDYPFAYDMNLEDLVILAGGFKESAENARIDVARRISSSEAQETMAEIFTFNVNKQLEIEKESKDFTLEPFDRVYIRKAPGYETQTQVMINGEVAYPGTYTLSKRNERLSSILERAGGLTEYAYAEGAKIIRELDQSSLDKYLKQRLSDNDTTLRSLDSIGVRTVGIDLVKLLENPGSDFDIVVQEGDVIEIPRLSQTVQLTGEVLYPSISTYRKSSSLRSYVSSAGGFTRKADKGRSFVVYANGSAKNTRNYILFKDYPKVTPGSEVVIPRKPIKDGLSIGEISVISSTLATLTFLIINISQSF